MIASTGAALLEPDAVVAYRELLFPLARLITPNLPEAEVLLGEEIPDEAALEAAAHRLAARFGTAVLVKGGHLATRDCLDVLADNGGLLRFRDERIPVAGSHGTGCTLSAAITAALARGEALPWAVETAKKFLGKCLRHSYQFAGPDGGIIHALNQATTFGENEA
jgi:hydroxymethylpyrimidine/phosphomethylpyrimidine kinase